MCYQWSVAKKALKKVESAGAAAAVAPEVHLAQKQPQDGKPKGGKGKGKGGKGKGKGKGAEEDGAQHSNNDFHLKVFQGEMTRLREFLESQQVLSGEIDCESIQAPDLVGALCKTFIFGTHTNAQARKQTGDQVVSEAVDELAVGLVQSLTRTFGLDACVERGLTTTEEMEKRFRKRLKDERVNWKKLFKTNRELPTMGKTPSKKELKKELLLKQLKELEAESSSDGGSSSEEEQQPKKKAKKEKKAKKASPAGEAEAEEERLPVKLEICSGFGEWVVAQAKAEAGVAHWGAWELRYDRLHSIFSRMLFEQVNNMCVLGGDASQLSRYIMPSSVDHIFVNFPEPPQTNMLQGAESKLHLLTKEFFEDMHKVLRQGGRVTILHDEHKYCSLLARTISSLNEGQADMFESVLGLRGKGKTKEDFEDVEGIRLYHGVPGKKSGHVVSSSSYFDQLWETKQRYFLVLAKC